VWIVKAKVILVVTASPRTISISFIKYLSNIPGKHEIKELETTALWALYTSVGRYLFKSIKH